MTTATATRTKCPTDLYDLIIDCPACAATGWVTAVTDDDEVSQMGHLTVECPTCCGHSWVPAIGDDAGQP